MNDSVIEVEDAVKVKGIPTITVESKRRMASSIYSRRGTDVAKAYEKLHSLPASDDTATTVVDNTDSYHKIQSLIFAHAHKSVLLRR